MKKVYFILSAIIFLSYSVNATELHVGSGQTYSTIQAAVDDAVSGDVIVIHAGTYREEVRIGTDGITIRRNGNDKVVLNGTEPLLSWTDEGNGVYSTTMDWDVTEGEQTNQIFVDGKMIHLARWPKETSDDIVMNPTRAVMNGVEQISWNEGEILDFEFGGNDTARWEGASIFINLSNPKCRKDGQGWTGPILDIVDGKIRAKAAGNGRYKSCGNWHIGNGSWYYLFNPTPSAVAATGGVGALLSDGEWWKDGNTLYIKTPDGNVPASDITGANLVEAKKYPYAFRPEEGGTFSNVTIKDLNLFATSITTDDDYLTRTSIAGASNNVLDNLNVKYVTHSYDCSGQFQTQWNGQSGIILSGQNNTLKNSIIEYSNASGVSLMGKANKLLDCFIFNVNYMVTESGAVNNGKKTIRIENDNISIVSVDHQIGYNTIYNTPHTGISIRSINEVSDEVTPGQARIHNNLLYDCLARAWDAAVIDGSRNKNGLRIDHNVIYNAPEFLQIGIYLDYGEFIDGYDDYHPAELILDHNVIYNIGNAIQVNACSDLQIYNNTVSSGKIDIGGVHLEDSNVFIRNNIATPDDFGEFAVIDYNVPLDNVMDHFTDPENGDYTLKSSATMAIDQGVDVSPYNDSVDGNPDIGAYEYGIAPWKAGADSNNFYRLNITSTNGNVEPANGLYRKGDVISIVASGKVGYAFTQWSGDYTGTDNPAEITMDSDKNITAEFETINTYTLTINIDNNEGEVRKIPDQDEYNEGSEVQVVVFPASTYKFVDWSGDVSDTAKTIVVEMTKNFNITAEFTPASSIEVKQVNNTVSYWPNPLPGHSGLHIAFEKPVHSSFAVKLYNLSGQMVYNNVHNGQTVEIPVQKLQIQKGIYVLELSLNDEIYRGKIIVH